MIDPHIHYQGAFTRWKKSVARRREAYGSMCPSSGFLESFCTVVASKKKCQKERSFLHLVFFVSSLHDGIALDVFCWCSGIRVCLALSLPAPEASLRIPGNHSKNFPSVSRTRSMSWFSGWVDVMFILLLYLNDIHDTTSNEEYDSWQMLYINMHYMLYIYICTQFIYVVLRLMTAYFAIDLLIGLETNISRSCLAVFCQFRRWCGAP